MTWNEVKIKEVAKQIRGVSYKPDDLVNEVDIDHMPILRANNITENGLDFKDVVFVNEKCISEIQVLKEGDIVIAASSGSKSIVGKASYYNHDYRCSFGAFCKVVRPNTKKISPKYLSYFFQSPGYRSRISHLSAGANINNLRNEHIDDLAIPLPPIPIQEQIVYTLDKADSLRKKDQVLQQKYDELAQSIFSDMFGDSLTNTKKWPIKKLTEVCMKITDGTHLSPKFLSAGIPFLFVSNIRNNKVCYDTDTYISEEEFDVLVKRTPIEIGNILLTTVGSYGNPAIIEREDKFAFQRHIAFIKPNHDLIDYRFLFGLFKSQFVQNQIERRVRGVAQKTLNLLDLKELEIYLPPLSLQHQYAEISVVAEKQRALVEEGLIKSDDLFKSLLQRTFK